MKRWALVFGISLIVLLVTLVSSSMAQGDFIKPIPPESPYADLPSEVQMQDFRHEVLHQVSGKENLHLLAGYYYGDPRQWKRIYRANRGQIRNPNLLRIGQILRIPVSKNWSPKYDYEEWFRLAIRGGEWVPRSRRRPAPTPPTVEPPTQVPTAQESPIQPEAPGSEGPAMQAPTGQEPSVQPEAPEGREPQLERPFPTTPEEPYPQAEKPEGEQM